VLCIRLRRMLIEYSVFALDIEIEQIKLLQACRELGVALIAYTSGQEPF